MVHHHPKTLALYLKYVYIYIYIYIYIYSSTHRGDRAAEPGSIRSLAARHAGGAPHVLLTVDHSWTPPASGSCTLPRSGALPLEVWGGREGEERAAWFTGDRLPLHGHAEQRVARFLTHLGGVITAVTAWTAVGQVGAAHGLWERDNTGRKNHPVVLEEAGQTPLDETCLMNEHELTHSHTHIWVRTAAVFVGGLAAGGEIRALPAVGTDDVVGDLSTPPESHADKHQHEGTITPHLENYWCCGLGK